MRKWSVKPCHLYRFGGSQVDEKGSSDALGICKVGTETMWKTSLLKKKSMNIFLESVPSSLTWLTWVSSKCQVPCSGTNYTHPNLLNFHDSPGKMESSHFTDMETEVLRVEITCLGFIWIVVGRVWIWNQNSLLLGVLAFSFYVMLPLKTNYFPKHFWVSLRRIGI